jgi:NAD(P)-dependent dehydrogenase (short-subunit alcohol dehydrogenase family)
MRLQHRATLVTGAASGIGRNIALLFAHEGARVLVVTDRDEAGAAETVRLIETVGGTATSYVADVGVAVDAQHMVDACLRTYGSIDILVNNAAVGSTQTVIDTDEETWDRVFQVNARGVFLGCKYAIPHMIEAGGGVIVNMASVAGLVGLKNRAAYSASKGAVIALTKAIAIDHVQQNIRCNCVCPGTVASPWVDRLVVAATDPAAERAALAARQPMGRLGTTDEIARAALYLASDDAAFVTGTAFIIDGGLTAQ